MSHVVVHGPASWNTVVHLDALPEPRPHMVLAREHHDGLGGTSAGKAVTLAALGVPTTLVTTLGDDDEAALVRRALHAGRGGDALRVVPRPAVQGRTERHVNLVARDGARLSVYLELPSAPPPDDEVLGLVRTARAAVLDLADSSRPLLDVARAAGVPVWCDVHDDDGAAPYARAFVAAADVLVVSGARLPDAAAYLDAAVVAGTTLAVCTRGAAGALARDADGWWEVEAAHAGPVLDTEGAGDAFLAGLLRATLAGAPHGRALAEAAAVGAIAVTTAGLGAPQAEPAAVVALADGVRVTRVR
ncbi:carbohydrate kinase family protein [Cellulomonas gilvus]|uniref:PfkB domain protein n=1 Tax=Cellulomonas gilvus (strain ATCC 13127 / NRRL B-14078) TaxID=593907 RepID=F8A2C4_CELGA|nr:PfkB family carbohydrate kinase [Cellulomonas gilvus]AEI11781.1 PfkB domain protein [Cellulomonas gilvus ATCC 13127]